MTPPTEIPGHTPDHVNCPACEAARLHTIKPAEFGALRFCHAWPAWLKEHRQQLSEKTIADYEYYLRSLMKFFAELPLRDIHIGHLEQYQQWRQQPHDDHGRTWTAGASAINHEINTLAQILDRAGLWTELNKFYSPLPQPKRRVGCKLSPEEEHRLFLVASSNPRWKVAYWASLLTANTSAGPNEIRHLRLCDIDFSRQIDGKHIATMTVREGVKNKYRERTIPLNASALMAIKLLVKRAKKLGASEPDHYLLPHRATSRGEGYDFLVPMGSWKKAWQSLREKAGFPHLRMYDLRHHAATKILENPNTSVHTAKAIMGHVSQRQIDDYSHIGLRAMLRAVEAAETKSAPVQLSFETFVDRRPPQNAHEKEVETKVGNLVEFVSVIPPNRMK